MALSLNLRSVEKVNKVIHQVGQVILGKDEEVREVMTAFLADGHILLEDIPGVGKTTLALAFSKSLQLDYKRVQFTPDVLPSDLTGFSIYRRDEERFVYRKGSVFCNLLLADEINRTSPKTQSALLEVMEEREVTVDGITRRVGRPFLVIATQNPAGSAGTQMLPEAQMDRFTVSMTLGYPDFESELTMIQAVGKDRPVMALEPVMGREELLQAQESIHQVYMKDSVSRYLLELVTATRNHPCIERGASPRASIALVKMSKAWAWLDGRDYVTPGDVYIQFPFVISHRIRLTSSAVMGRQTKEEIIKELLSQVSLPSMGLR
ncbi:MoxR family ATPase [Catenibacillus scindens]|uniref:AAA family ATPase n=1 Tax=Catenibacillus scindens TaxID=673271 RepID=UPI0032098F7A